MNNRLVRIGLRVVFALSLLLNALTVGVLLQLSEIRSFYGLGDARLPRDIRRDFFDMARGDAELAAESAKLGAARTRMVEIGSALELDQAALEAAMAEVRDQTLALQQKSQALLVEAILKNRD